MNYWSRVVREQFSGPALPLIAFSAALNLSIGHVVTTLKLPLYLDSTGTVLASIVCGAWAGVAAGLSSAIVGSALLNPYLIWYAPVVVAIAALSAFLSSRGFFRTWPRVIAGGLLQAVVAATVAAPITTYLFAGVTLAGTSLIVAYLRSTGQTLLKSVFFAGLSAEPIDKTLTYVFAFLIVRALPMTLLHRYPRTQQLRPRKQ